MLEAWQDVYGTPSPPSSQSTRSDVARCCRVVHVHTSTSYRLVRVNLDPPKGKHTVPEIHVDDHWSNASKQVSGSENVLTLSPGYVMQLLTVHVCLTTSSLALFTWNCLYIIPVYKVDVFDDNPVFFLRICQSAGVLGRSWELWLFTDAVCPGGETDFLAERMPTYNTVHFGL